MKASASRILIPALVVFSALLPSPVWPEDADIVIRKTASPEGRMASANTLQHTVRAGETLGGILVEKGFSPAEVPGMLPAVLELNPSLADPRLIFPGQQLVIPAPGSGPSPSYGKVPPDPTVADLEAAGRLRPLLRGTLQRFGESFSDSGTLHLPLGDLGTVNVDGASYPLVEFSSGRSVILDTEGSLAPAWAAAIPGFWPAYTVLSPAADMDTRALVGGLLGLSGYHSVVVGEAFTIGREASVTIVPDFLILKTPESLAEGRVYLVNVDDRAHAPLPAEIRSLASDHRISIVEVDPAAEDYDSSPQSAYELRFAAKFSSPNRRLLLQELAPRLGLGTDGLLALPGPSAEAGLSFTAGTSLIVRTEEKSCLLYFDEDEGRPAGLAAGGGTAVYAGPGEPLLQVLQNLLSVLGIDFEGPLVEFYRTRDRHRVTVPGLYLLTPEGPLFIIDRHVGDHLLSYLAGTGMKVILLELVAE